MIAYAEIALPLPFNRTFFYKVPGNLLKKIKIGSIVVVPLKRRLLTGVVVKLLPKRPPLDIEFKEIKKLLDENLAFSPSFLDVTRRIAEYFYSAWGELLLAALPPQIAVKGGKATPPSKKRENVQFFSPQQLEIDFSLDNESFEVAERISQSIGKQNFSPFLLQASQSKREAVYLFLIKACLAKGKRVLFLVPEIAYTRELVSAIERKLARNTALLHSGLSQRSRELEWRKVKDGWADVVIGTRLAALCPVENVGLMIVDREQDESYFQRENPVYDARKAAWIRAEQEFSVLVYGASFPSVESRFRALKQDFFLSIERPSPQWQGKLIDGRKTKELISREIIAKIEKRLAKKEQVMLFCHRRGYAAFLICSRCHYIPHCVRCDANLSFHKREGKVVCHYCSYSADFKNICPECGCKIIRKRGPGIQVIEEKLREYFPQQKLAVFDTDAAGSRKKREEILLKFHKRKIDILLGTSLLAHQKEFPKVSLVVVLYPESLLALSDYQANQRTFQSITQMVEFLKNEKEAEVVVQTLLPEHFSIHGAVFGDYLEFYKEEIQSRKLMNYPPFSYLVELVFQGTNLRSLGKDTRSFFSQLKAHKEEVEIWGPSKALVSRIRNRNRVQFLIKAQGKEHLDRILQENIQAIRARKAIYVYE